MSVFRWLLATGLVVSATWTSLAQESAERIEVATEIPTEGFWPTERMLDRILDRITTDLGKIYEMDEEQIELTRVLLKERVPEFMNENRAEMQTLMNQFFEASLGEEPPDPKDVAVWAKRALPMMERFAEFGESLSTDMREYLTEDQGLRMEGELAAFRAGVSLATGRLGLWADGGYDPAVEWPKDRTARGEQAQAEHEAMVEEMRDKRDETLSGEGVAQPGAEPAVASGAKSGANRLEQATRTVQATTSQPGKDEWDAYVDSFTQRYRLSTEQIADAQRILKARKSARDEYLRRRAAQVAKVTRQLQEAKTDAERQSANAAFAKLNAPVDRMFQQLKDNLDALLTREQRAKAAAKDSAGAREASTATVRGG